MSMKFRAAVFGGTGLIGRSLVNRLLSEGYAVSVFSRNKNKTVDLLRRNVRIFDFNEDLTETLENHNIIINLAGERISKRWTHKRKNRIRDSRVNSTSRIINSINRLKNKPDIYLQASAIGYYPFSDSEIFTESSQEGNSFLSGIVSAWEAAADPLDKDVRKIFIRTGVVLSMDGGMLPKLILPIRMFAGGTPGRGNGWISWIHIEDLVRAVLFLINNRKLSGIFNLCSPEPVTLKYLVSYCGKILKRPTILKIPEYIIRLFFGKMGEETILGSRQVIPQKLLNNGFEFKFPEIKGALNDQLSEQ